jgi:hypothetical protein
MWSFISSSAVSRKILVGSILPLVIALTVGQVAFARGDAPTVDELRRLISRTQDSVADNPARGELEEPPEARDPTAPATVLFEVKTALDELSRDEDRPLNPRAIHRLARAQEAVGRAFDQYGRSKDLGVVMDALSDAVRNLQSIAPSRSDTHHEAVERLSNKLASVAQSIATGLVGIAERAGARPHLLRVAHIRLTIGEQLLERGQYTAAIAQFGGATDLASNGIAFDIDKFEQNIQDALDEQTVGHAYTIARNGLLYSQGAQGFARTAADPPITAQSPSKEIYIASMSKTISALALLKALDAEGISVGEGISDFLPSAWTQGAGVSNVTFRHLLTHQSGLDPNGLSCCTEAGQTLETLEQIIETGTPGILGFSQADYTNANYSLLRILIPQITIGEAVISNYANVLPEDFVYAELYAQFVTNEVLQPANVNVPGCSPREDTSSRTQYYSFTSPGDPGIDLGDWSLSCGATGWYLSAFELGSLLAFVRHTNSVIDDEIRDLMDDGNLGWLNPITFSSYVDGEFGVYSAHGGDIGSGGNPGMTGCMMNYPIQVQATLLINSRGGNLGGHACTLLRDAFDNAWVAN